VGEEPGPIAAARDQRRARPSCRTGPLSGPSQVEVVARPRHSYVKKPTLLTYISFGERNYAFLDTRDDRGAYGESL
jgi:hypothetical protein